MKKGCLVLLALILSACSDNPDVTTQTPGGGGASVTTTTTTTTLPAPPPGVDHIHIIPNGNVQIPLGSTQIFSSVAHDIFDAPVSGATFGWSSSNPTQASIAADSPMLGQATVTGDVATTAGLEPIITLSSGGFTDTAIVTVTCQTIPAVISSITATPNPVSTLGNVSIGVQVDDCDPLTPPNVPAGTTVLFSLDTTTLGSLTASSAPTNTTGLATGSFVALNAFGTVRITATVSGTAISNFIDLVIQPTPVGSIKFTSATPTVLGLQGSGQQESSIIVFTVNDINNNPIADGTSVLFTLVGPKGTSSVTGPTDPTQEALTFYSTSTLNGEAKTVLTSGTAPGPVQITACVDSDNSGICETGEVKSTTSNVSIGGGLPSAQHFSFVTNIKNMAGLFWVNEQATLSAFLADRFGNFNILEGTSVSFITEAGAVDRSAITDATGFASVTLRTQDPLPIDVDVRDPLSFLFPFTEFSPNPNQNGFTVGEPFEDADNDGVYDPGEPFTDWDYSGYNFLEPNIRDGHVSVVAYTFGEEEFSDINGNGVYDLGEPFVDNGGEPFIDANDNGIYDLTESFTDIDGNNSYNELIEGEFNFTDADPPEPYFDSNGNGSYDAGEPYTEINWTMPLARDAVAVGFANGVYDRGETYIDFDKNGAWTHGNGVWDGPGSPMGDQGTVIWKRLKLLFSSEPAFGGSTSRIIIKNSSMHPSDPSRFFLPNGGCADFTIFVMDENGNHLESPSTVTIVSGKGKLSNPSSWTFIDTVSISPWSASFQLCDDNPTTIQQESTTVSAIVSWQTQAGTIDYSMGIISGTLDYSPAGYAITNPSPLPDGQLTFAYSEFLTAVNGTPPYTWNVSLGSLPPGLSLNSATGEIFGTPTVAAPCTDFDITVTDSLGFQVFKTFCINVIP